MKQPTQRAKITTRELIQLSLFAALMIVSKEALAFLPNVEVVTVLIIALTHQMGAKSLWSVYAFVIVELLIYPFGIWMISFLYVWAVLVAVVLLLRKHAGTLLYTIVAAIFGILFGTLCSIPSFFLGGFGYGVSWIITGLSFDITHMIGNAATTALLFYPLKKALGNNVK